MEYARYSSRSNSAWGKLMGSKTKYEGGDADDPMASGDFMAEDIFACEQQQKSLKSPLFSVGASAKDLEKSVRDFQSVVLGYVKNGIEKEA